MRHSGEAFATAAAWLSLVVFSSAMFSSPKFASGELPSAVGTQQAPQAQAQEPQGDALVARALPSVPAITYEKTFKGSVPEYVEITIRRDGGGTWDIRQLDEDAARQAFTVSASLTGEIFRLAGQLHNFAGINLDAERRIAYLGKKTFRYEQGANRQEVTYNYTLNEDAAELQRIFEGLGREEGDIQDLRRVMRYDRLGVNDVLLRIESDVNANAIPAPENLTPVLDQISSDERYMEIARQRAQSLAERLRAGAPAAASQPASHP
jgi:hypothetical protein